MVVAASNYNKSSRVSNLLRSTDGGVSWSSVYTIGGTITQVIAKPDDYNIQLAAINNFGIIKSTDAGLTWELQAME